MFGVPGATICMMLFSATFWAFAAPTGSIERERSNLPHVIIRPAPTERCSQILNDTVGWRL